MKRYLYSVICILSVLTVLFSSCEKTPQNTPETFASDKARPTWTAIEQSDMSSSMTAVVKVDLKAQYPESAADFVLNEGDLLAAFSGETCLGTATLQDGLFFLYIAGQTSNSDSGLTSKSDAVTLRYYSAHYKNLFEAKDAFPFVNDNHLGTVAEPLICNFALLK